MASSRFDATGEASGPTRRALLALMPVTLLDGVDFRNDAKHSASAVGARQFERRWADLMAAVLKQDVAIAHRDRLEEALLRHLEAAQHPDPAATAGIPFGEPDPEIGASFIPIGEVITALVESVADRLRKWEQGATRIGLPEAEEAQASALSDVKRAACDLVQQPATDLTHLRLKLMALIAVHEPGPGCRHQTPWRELRLVLSDVETLLTKRQS